MISIFLDLSKAFDLVDHQILLNKLYAIGLRGSIHGWMKSYLSDCMQRVTIDGASSPWKLITRGVPRGSILGPLLFLIYINDMSSTTNKLDFIRICKEIKEIFLSKLDTIKTEFI